jgi:hypothetical protein
LDKQLLYFVASLFCHFSSASDLLMANSILIVVYKHLREKSIVAPTVL